MDDLARCIADARALLRDCATPQGFVASAADGHYRAVWARDALISAWGAIASGEDDLVATSTATLRTLAACQAARGQIPAVVWIDEEWWDWADAGATDASALFALTACMHALDTGDDVLWNAVQPAVDRALGWLAAQDPANLGLVDSPDAADWMDSSLHRGGKVLSTNVVYARALALRERLDPAPTGLPDPAETAWALNLLFWPEPGVDPAALLTHVHGAAATRATWRHPVLAAAYRRAALTERTHYVSHVRYGQFGEVCDVLGNALALLFGIAPASRVGGLIDCLAPAAEPLPSRCWLAPALPDDDPSGLWHPEVDALQDPRWRNPPHAYHNAGVWPFVGGLHAAAVAVRGQPDVARQLLDRVAAANQLGDGFHEWIHGETEQPAGAARQAWNAGTLVLAEALCAGKHTALTYPA